MRVFSDRLLASSEYLHGSWLGGIAERGKVMRKREINASDAPAFAGQYAQAIEVTGATKTIYISGQVGIATDGTVPNNAETQAKLAWRIGNRSP